MVSTWGIFGQKNYKFSAQLWSIRYFPSQKAHALKPLRFRLQWVHIDDGGGYHDDNGMVTGWYRFTVGNGMMATVSNCVMLV